MKKKNYVYVVEVWLAKRMYRKGEKVERAWFVYTACVDYSAAVEKMKNERNSRIGFWKSRVTRYEATR